MDILDDFPVEEEPMEPELVSEFMVIIKEKHGFPEFAEETLLYAQD